MKKWYKFLLYILPLILCFSYYPVIPLGGNETMNFELSLPLLWLVVFDVFSFVMVLRKYRKQIFTKVFGSILWWLFPIFATFSIAWSLNPLRGFLTVGVMWLLFFAVISFYELRENLDANFWKVFWRWFFGSAIIVCVWCVVQCILDVAGVSKEVSLLCDGCVYQMFGFPHPNGWAIEPQFMGNLLIAPIFVMLYSMINPQSTCNISGASLWCNQRLYTKALPLRRKNQRFFLYVPRFLQILYLFIMIMTLFLTMSRGAIYAVIVGMVCLFSFLLMRAKKIERKNVSFSILKILGIFVLGFFFTLNLQGILAAVSPASDTYGDGVAKVLNQLSLGVIDVRGEKEEKLEGINEPVENSEEITETTSVLPVENFKETEPVFEGYVAESTDTRVRLSKAAGTIWQGDFKTAMIGVGIGGAGQALYNNGFSPAPKEIVQNEYMEILLETGIIGVSLFAIIVVMSVRIALKAKMPGLLLSLMVAYGISLLFFSGLPNALQIVLLTGLFYFV